MGIYESIQSNLKTTFLFVIISISTLFAQDITLHGHVYSSSTSSGELIPIAGAQVGIGMNSVPEGTITHSDENGYYELHFEWNWDGPIPIVCEAEGYEFYVSTFIPDAAGTQFEHDIFLTPATGGGGDLTHLEGNVWQNNGCLGGPVGCPIEGATISAVPLNSPNDVVFSAFSDNWGHYSIDIPIGAYMITCSAEGWLSDSVDMTISTEGAVYDFHLFEDGINTEVYFSGTVSGEVSPQLPAFAPIEGAVVFLFGGFTGGILAETHTDENGYFEFGDVVMSATAVVIEATGYVRQDHSIMELCDSSNPNSMDCFPLEHDFYLNLGSTCEDLSDFHFGDCEMVIGIGWNGEHCTWFSGCGTVDQNGVDHADSFFDSLEECNDACTDVAEHGTLAGEVFYQWGDAIELVAGAEIQVHGSANHIYETETNENGFYIIENIPVGNYAVSCTVHTGETMTQDVEIMVGTSAMVDFWFGEPDYPNVLTGMVYGSDEELSVILDGHIIAHTMDGDLFETWIEGGSYWLDLPWAAPYYISVEAEGYFSAEATVIVNGITEMDFYLTPIDDGMVPDAILSLGDGIGISNGDITIPLFLSSDVPISSLEFAVYPLLENWDEWYYLEPSGLESTHECFSAEWGDVYGQLWGIMAGVNGCVFESHEMQHIANLTFTSHDDVPTGYEIPMIFNYLMVLDADDNEVFAEGEGSTITFVLMGDINFDGTINVLDVVALVNFVIYIDEPNNAEFSAGDLNHDGMLNVLDVVLMVNIILGD